MTGKANARARVGVEDAALAAVRDAAGVAAVAVAVAAAAPRKRALYTKHIVSTLIDRAMIKIDSPRRRPSRGSARRRWCTRAAAGGIRRAGAGDPLDRI